MTPIGLFISYMVFQKGPLEKISGIVESISGGIFLYISVFHILAEELENPEFIGGKILMFAFSLSLMFLIEFIH